MGPREIIAAYFQRWDIQVNFAMRRSWRGGQAQARAADSVESAPALTVAAYAMLPAAAQRAFGNSRDGWLPQPIGPVIRNLPVSPPNTSSIRRAPKFGPVVWYGDFIQLCLQPAL